MRKKKQSRTESAVPKPRPLKNGQYGAQVMAAGERRFITGSTIREYESKARAYKAGILEMKKAPDYMTLSDAIDKYILSRGEAVSPSTIQTYKKKKRLYFLGLMDKNIYTLAIGDLSDELVKMISAPGVKGKTLSAKTVNDAYKFIVSVLTYHKINLDFSSVPLPQVQASPYAVLTKDEQARLIQGVRGNPCELEILLALWLGLRRSEIIALEKSDFDLAHNTVSISKAIVRNENGEYVSKGTKTARSARKIEIPDYIAALVKARPDGRIYAYDANYILKCLHRVCKENGLPPVRLHDLRHINASVGLMLGVPDKYIMERNGWASKDTMVYRYEHTYSAEKRQADAAFNAYFEELLNG